MTHRALSASHRKDLPRTACETIQTGQSRRDAEGAPSDLERAHIAARFVAIHLSDRALTPARLPPDPELQATLRGLCIAAQLTLASSLDGLHGALASADFPSRTLLLLRPDVARCEPSESLLRRLHDLRVVNLGEFYEALLGLEWRWDESEPAASGSQHGSWRVSPGTSRRRGGSHFTPAPVANAVVRGCLEPLLGALTTPEELLALKICDPAAGAGALLVTVRSLLTERLIELSTRGSSPLSPAEARAQVHAHCLFSNDLDPIAVALCHLALDPDGTHPIPTHRIHHGDAVVGPNNAPVPTALQANQPLDWHSAFPEVFARENPGFDAIVGNPPWVAYVGRAAQPLSPELRAHYQQHYASFRNYKTLHGVFVERATSLLRRGGRLGLVLPTSVADLSGYRRTRLAHDVHCEPDDELPDFGDGRFPGVFQPCMGLLSTRTHEARGSGTWRLSRRDLSRPAADLLERLEALPKCPPTLFGERGYQTTKPDRERLQKRSTLPAGHQWLFTGTEVAEFRRLPPRWSVDPKQLAQRFRPMNEWQATAVWIRQTARYPIAALGNGLAFRNSILAGFEIETISRYLLVAYLNSSPVRWFHYHSQRDARQGMPQLKVAHLRALPAPPASTTPHGAWLHDFGRRLSEHNGGISVAERAELDATLFDWLAIPARQRRIVDDWALRCPPPVTRGGVVTQQEGSHEDEWSHENGEGGSLIEGKS